MKISISSNATGSLKAWLMIAAASLFYLYEVALRASPGVMVEQLRTDLHLNASQIGFLGSCYYLIYVALQIPAGAIVDRLGVRKLLTFSCLMCSVGTFIFCSSNSFWLLAFGRLLIGAGSACAFISCLKVASDWFHPLAFPFVAGFANTMGTLGGTFAGPPLAWFVNQLGWQEASYVLAFFGLGVAAFLWFTLKDKGPFTQETGHMPGLQKTILHLLKNKTIIFVGIVGGLMYLPISVFGELWAVPFLMQAYGIDNQLASSISVWVFIGAAIGGPFIALFLKRGYSILDLMRVTALLMAFLFLLITYANALPMLLVFATIFLVGIAMGGQVLCFSLGKAEVSDSIQGVAMGLINSLVMLGGLVFQGLLGSALDYFWDGSLSANGLRVYSQHSYQLAILLIPASLFAAWLILLKISPAKRLQEAS